jgi:hypothetical protein
MAFYELDEVTEYIANLLTTNRIAIGLNGIFREEAQLLLNYPVGYVLPVRLRRTGTQVGRNFELEFHVAIYVIHTQLSQTAAARTQTDLQTARRVVTTLHGDMTLGGNIPGSWVQEEQLVTPRFRGTAQVATELQWIGKQREVAF